MSSFYEKHIIECDCIHPSVIHSPNPPKFSFAVISEITKDNKVKPKFVKCSNCDRIHDVYEIGQSRVVFGGSYRELNDVRKCLPEALVKILDEYVCDYATYEECEIMLKHKIFNKRIILTRQVDDGDASGKVLIIKKKGEFVVESYNYRAKDYISF